MLVAINLTDRASGPFVAKPFPRTAQMYQPPPRPMSHSGPATRCRICHQPLPQGTSDVCDRPPCQTRLKAEAATEIARRKKKKDAAWLEMSTRRTRPVLRQAAREVGAQSLAHVAHALAPFIDLPLRPLPEDRRAAFVDHLTEIIDAAFATADGISPTLEPPEDDPDYTTRLAHETPEPFVLNAACIACQGDCCTLGGGRHAFLTKETITYQRWRDPEITKEALTERYLSAFPEVSVIGSCVYHGPQGCTLDRPLRANICNSFQCLARRELADAVARRPGTGAVVAGLSRNHADDPSAGAPYLRVVSVSPSDEVTVHDNLKLPALRKGMPED